jgi:hypothetical protein
LAILMITAAEVAQIARLDLADSAIAADVGGVLTAEQAAVEQTLDPAAFTLPGVADLLRRNVAKRIAAEVLAMRARAEGAVGDLLLGTGAGEVRLGRVPDFAATLRAEADAALAPYTLRQTLLGRQGPSPTLCPATLPLTDRDGQERLYGPSEGERLAATAGRERSW